MTHCTFPSNRNFNDNPTKQITGTIELQQKTIRENLIEVAMPPRSPKAFSFKIANKYLM